MSPATSRVIVEFPKDYDAQSAYETPSRGYLSEIVVQLEDGSRYQLFFIDPVRLQQELTDQVQLGRAYWAEPNLVVLPRVTTEAIHQAVEGLAAEDFFKHLKPL
jgi:hypothetical protein